MKTEHPEYSVSLERNGDDWAVTVHMQGETVVFDGLSQEGSALIYHRLGGN